MVSLQRKNDAETTNSTSNMKNLFSLHQHNQVCDTAHDGVSHSRSAYTAVESFLMRLNHFVVVELHNPIRPLRSTDRSAFSMALR